MPEIKITHDGLRWVATVHGTEMRSAEGATQGEALRGLADKIDVVPNKVAITSERGAGTIPDVQQATKTGANAVQVGGSHYKAMPIEHWDWVAVNGLDYFQGNITKYVARWKLKGGIADLEKAQHYLQKYIELEKERLSSISNLTEGVVPMSSLVITEAPVITTSQGIALFTGLQPNTKYILKIVKD